MPVFNYPYIRDTLTINDKVQKFYDNYAGEGAVFLLGRVVQHAEGINLRLSSRPLVIVADTYDGTRGMIVASGVNATISGNRGADGVYPRPDSHVDGAGVDRPIAPGGDGFGGGAGAPGGIGGVVTVMCRKSINAHISVVGGAGSAGGAGGNGSHGVNGHVIPDWTETIDNDPFDDIPPQEIFHPGETIFGTPGGSGGYGGAGGAGGNGGAITFISIADEGAPILEVGGGRGGPGGPGGRPGPDGYLSEGMASEGSAGSEGSMGLANSITSTFPKTSIVHACVPRLAPGPITGRPSDVSPASISITATIQAGRIGPTSRNSRQSSSKECWSFSLTTWRPIGFNGNWLGIRLSWREAMKWYG